MVSEFWLLSCVCWLPFRNPLCLAIILPVSSLSYEKVFAFNGSCLLAVLAGGMPSLPWVTPPLPDSAAEINTSSCLRNILISLLVVMKNGQSNPVNHHQETVNTAQKCSTTGVDWTSTLNHHWDPACSSLGTAAFWRGALSMMLRGDVLMAGQGSFELHFSFAWDCGCGWEGDPSPCLGREGHGPFVWDLLQVL